MSNKIESILAQNHRNWRLFVLNGIILAIVITIICEIVWTAIESLISYFSWNSAVALGFIALISIFLLIVVCRNIKFYLLCPEIKNYRINYELNKNKKWGQNAFFSNFNEELRISLKGKIKYCRVEVDFWYNIIRKNCTKYKKSIDILTFSEYWFKGQTDNAIDFNFEESHIEVYLGLNNKNKILSNVVDDVLENLKEKGIILSYKKEHEKFFLFSFWTPFKRKGKRIKEELAT